MLEELTKNQKLIWMIEQYYKKTSINNIPGAGILMEQVDFEKLEESIKIVCNKYDNFRIRIKMGDGKPKQFLSDLKSLEIEKINVKDTKELNKKMEKISETPINSENNLLFKFYIFKLANGQGAFMLNINHLISDGWTSGIICNEIIKIYSKLKQNQEIERTTIYSYMDYIKHEKEYEKSEKFKKDQKYWEEIFARIPEITKIPGSIKKCENENNPKAKRKQFKLNKEQVIKIKEFCKENRISVYNFFMAVYGIYIGEISNLNEFVIGTPILNRTNYKEKNTAGLFINMLPFKININEKQEFKEYLREIAIDSMQMLKHQKYSYQYILEDLRKKDNNIPSLYNILLSYQITNANNSGENVNYTAKWLFNGNCAEDIDIQIYDLDDTGSLDIAYDYRTSLYNDTDMERMHNRIINMIEQILQNEDIKIQDIDIVTKEEKEKIISKFNETKLNYDKQDTIINLFEQQVKRTPDKVAIISNGQKLTYKELNQKANILAKRMIEEGIKQEDVVGIMINRSSEMIIGLISIIKCGATYLPIDPEYPLDRISYMLENSETKNVLVNNKTEKYVPNTINKINIEKIEFDKYSGDENINLKINPQSLIYIIYTSGSTGKPKGVRITNQNLNNFINGMKKIIDFSQDKTMVSVTTICFDIFGLEIWCTLTSGLSLVIADEEEQNTPSKLNKLCLENNVNIIQTTPSRYSVIFEEKKNLEFAKNLTDILIGGETANNKIISKMQNETKAKIFNMYGPTETTIWSTVKELTNEKTITIGKPIANTQCYILNKNHKILPIGVPGELYIGGDGVSNGYLKREELNQDKFINNKFGANGKLYNTNDLAYYSENGDIVHLGRTDFQVKIHGFRVELGEIENIIEKNKNVKQAIVVKRKLKTGHDVLVAYYTTRESEKIEFKHELENELPQYMIPQYFVKLGKMPYTQNGKIDRKNLPEPNFENREKKIINARNEIDIELIKIIEKMLQIKNVSISDTLLELGGDSLTAITLSTKILSKFNVQMNIKELLSNYTIQDMSDYINENQFKESQKIKIEKAPKQDYYPLSSAQKRIYYNTKMIGDNNIVYNMPGAILVDEILEKEKVQKVFERIAERHAILRTGFVLINDKVMQKIEDKIDFKIEIYNNKATEIQDIVNNFARPFDLEKPPLIRVELHYLDNKKTLLLLDTHHIIMDGTSLNNLIIEFNRLYNGEDLKNIPIKYKDYSVWEEKYNNSDLIKPSENYWVNKFKDCEFAQLNLPYDYKMPVNKSYNGKRISNVIDEHKFKKIEKFAKKCGVSPYMFFISTFFVLLYKYTGQTDINIGSPIANRNINETKRMLGMFVNNIVVRGKINADETFREFLNEIKEQILEDLSDQPYPFDMLVKKLGIKTDNSRNPLFDVMFTYQNKEENIVKIDDKETQIIEINNNISKFNLSIEVKPKTHIINIEYCTDLFKENTIKRLFEHYMNVIEDVMIDKDMKIKNIEIISKEEKNEILQKFNDTQTEYPKNKTITQLFEEQVEKTPNNIAVVFEDKRLTYKELNEKANQLANYLKEQNISSEDVIAILLDKSLEMIIAILAILKNGCAYLPIDISYPKERKEYILKDSKAKMLLTSRELNLESDLLIKSIYIDMDTEKIYSSEKKENLNYQGKSSDLAYIMYTSGSTGKPKGVMVINKNIVRLVKNTDYIKFKENDKILQTGSIVFDACTFEIWGALLNGLELYVIKKEELLDASLLHTYILKNKITVLWLTAPLFNQLCEENPHMFRSVRCVLSGGDVLSCKHINMVKVANPELTIINGYGPTENTTFSCCHTIDKKYTNSIPIGKPIANSTGYVVSKDGNLQPIGIPGELWVGGDGVSRGYVNNPGLTNEKFINNPFGMGKVYKTGDLTKWNYNGTIEFLGRIDNQIKIRGFRVELSEITSVATQYENIREAYTIIRENENEKNICTYIVGKTKIDIEHFKNYLNKFLPKYMIPKYIIQLKELPKNQNGKIDKNALPEVSEKNNKKREIVFPTNEIEEKVYNCFKTVLQLKELSIEDNFFDEGGDSISAMKLQIEALKNNLSITYADIFKYPTIKSMAKYLESTSRIKNSDTENDYSKYDGLIIRNTIQNLKDEQIPYTPIGNVLLTGVTGFLGAHILDSYLKNETGVIYCLIRGKNHLPAIERLQNVLHFYFKDKYDEYIGTRIRCVEGDITLQNLGMTIKKYNELGKDISTVIHSAALVKHFGNYKEFEEINVKGTRKIVEFCKEFNIRLMHISTISVSGNNFAEGSFIENNIKEEIKYGENKFFVGQNLENLYVRSKFLAEKEVLEAICNGLEAYILRMGNLTSRFSEGKFQQNHLENAFVNRVKTFLQLGCLPEYMMDGYAEFTPIDYSGDAIIKIANHYDRKFSIWHLLNNKHLLLTKFYDILHELGIDLKILPSEEFAELIDKLLKDDEKSNILQGIIRDFDSNKKLVYESDIKIKSDFTNEFLERLDFEWPEIDKKYIKKYLEYLIQIGYLNIKLKEE